MSSLVYLLLCLSLHACSARHLGATDKESNKGYHLFGMALEKEKLHDTLIPPNVSPSLSEEIPRQETQMGKNDERGVHQSWGNHIKQKDNDQALFNQKKDNKVVALAGNEVIAYSQHFVQGTIEIEGWKRQQQRWLGSTPEDAKETIDDSKEDDAVENIVEMDYAQPHRKPPIHNR